MKITVTLVERAGVHERPSTPWELPCIPRIGEFIQRIVTISASPNVQVLQFYEVKQVTYAFDAADQFNGVRVTVREMTEF